ncbi:MAG: aminotransferase class V-fold PLP-dependent enzyme, partial [Candidatus Methylomirabilis sp.]|nr:aminotransferase class V-fold PLP-dependent enzyme [Deltaproteobacteria bacterium]
SGTLAVPLIVGMGAAAELAGQLLADESKRLSYLRDKLEGEVLKACDFVYVNGDKDHRLPNTTNLSFEFIEGESFIMALPEICVSSGSACTSASLEPSHVIRALGVKEELAHSSIRFTLGRRSTEQDVDTTIEKVKAAVKRLRDMSPLYEMAQKGMDINSIKWTAGEGARH